MSVNPYDVQVEKLECIELIQKCMGSRLLDPKNKAEKKKLNDGKIQRNYGMAIRNNINDLHSMKTAVLAVYVHLSSSNESSQHGLRPESKNTCASFKIQKLNVTKSTMTINTYTCAIIYHNELDKANF
ncbi:hypothetical protein TNCV_3660571 [Trichonephila clavipes]|nr:hypothetical protein TNCV_3660571 [Trichonephila clavipes]